MSFITESKKAYRQVEILEKDNSDHEISMARSELESTADKALAISSMLQSKSDIGNPLEAWVQSKITKAKDYITSVHDYLKYTPGMNESFDLEENTFEKIYQMQQDGKSSEDIAKELKLNPALVKKVLGEQIELKEFTDTQIAALKKEYDPLKGKTITTAQYQQLKNILFKLKDGDLEKLQKQNIPFASTGAGSILRVRKAPVKITSVKVPGLEGMAEAIDMSKVTKYKMISIKGDQKEITIDREDLEKHLKLGYVIKEPLTEEPKNPYAIGMAAAMKATGDTPPLKKSTITKAHKIADKVKEEEVEIEENISQVTTKKNGADTDIFYKGKHIGYFHKITSQYGEGKIGNYFVYHDNEDDPEDFTQSDEVSSEAQAKKIAYDSAKFNGLIEEKQAYGGKATDPEHQANYKATDEMRSIKAKRQQLEKELRALNKDDPSYKEKSAQKRKEIETQRELMARKQKEVYGSFDPSIEEVNKTNTKSDEKRTIDMTDGSAHVRFPKDDTKAMEFYKSKGYKVTTKYEETELEEACWTGYKKVGMKKKGDRMVPNCVPEGYVTESGDIVEFVELNEGQFKEIDTRKGDLKLAKDKKQNLKDKYNAIMAGQATGDENSIADQIQKLDMSIKKQEQELIDIMKKQRETKKEEVELQEKPSIKQYVVFHSDDSPTKHKDFKAYDETELNKQIGEFLKQNPGYKVYGKSPSQSIKELTSRNINEGARALVEAIAALQKKADKSGMPYSILKQVYDRGMAAWKGGHRPGAGQHQWAFARVNSFVTKSSGTWGGADSDLAKKVKGKE